MFPLRNIHMVFKYRYLLKFKQHSVGQTQTRCRGDLPVGRQLPGLDAILMV